MAKVSKLTKVSVISSMTVGEASATLVALVYAINAHCNGNPDTLKDMVAVRNALDNAGVHI